MAFRRSTWVSIAFICFAIFAISGAVFGLAALILQLSSDATPFKLLQLGLPLPQHSISSNSQIAPFDERVVIFFCTNQTVTSSQTVTFSGTTIGAYNCPDFNNPCSENICSINSGSCEIVLNDGAQCDSDFSCGPSSICNNSTCQCQTNPATTTGCVVDSDCPNVEGRNDCVEQQCILSRCVEVTLGQCWFDNQCFDSVGPGSVCNTTAGVCSCFQEPQCFIDSDCQNPDPDNICFFMDCQDGDCIPEATVQCWEDEQCTQPTEFCNTTSCVCQTRQPVLCSPPDVGCPVLHGVGSCAAFQCLGGECIQSLVGLSECSLDTDCNQPLEYCEIDTCTCELVPVVQCQVDDDCQDISILGPCAGNQCLNGTCTLVTASGECFRDEQCSQGFSCDSMSSCMCISDANSCISGYNIMELPPEGSGLNLTCGYDISISGDLAEVLCINFQSPGVETWTIISFVKTNDTWDYGFSVFTTITFEASSGPIPDRVAFLESSEQNLVFVFGRFFNDVPPQSFRVDVFDIISNGQLSFITSIILPTSNTTEICLSVYGEDVLAVNGVAYYYIRTGPTTWTLNQTITEPNNATWFDCDLFDDTMVLSVIDSTAMSGETWYSYLYNTGTGQWDNVAVGMNPSPSDESWYVSLLQNNLRPDDENSFTVVSAISSIPTSTIQVFNAGALSLSGLQFITSSGPANMSSYERNILIADTLFRGGIGDGFSFQRAWEGSYVFANDLYVDQPVFSVVNTSGDFILYANWCLDDA